MKVLHVQKASGIGGSERYLLSLLPALSERGIEVRMMVLAAGDFNLFVDPLRAAGVTVVVAPAGPDVNPITVRRIRREIRRFEPDIVHTHLIHADLYGQRAARAEGVPGVATHHGTHPFFRRQPYRLVSQMSGRMARRNIAVSQHVARFLADLHLARPGAVRVIPIGMEVPDGVASPANQAAARSELKLTQDEVAVGVASRLVPLKGHDLLMDGFAQGLQLAPSLRLLVAGDGALRAELEARARRQFPPGVVRFLGFVRDIESFISACDVFAFPTLPGFGEGFGLAALEAMAAGRPVVATAVDSLPEIVVDGETGFLVAPGSIDELASALVALALDSDLKERLGAQARRRVAEQFSLEKMVDSTLAIYGDVAGSDSDPRRKG